MNISDKTVGRLSLYRRLLYRFAIAGQINIYSHQIAASSGITSTQVRRDLMVIGYSGSPNRGYRINDLIVSIGEFLDDKNGQQVALVGVGNLGRAILAHFAGRRPKLTIVAAFDVAPDKVNRVIHGCRCYSMTKFSTIVKRENITISILAVPADAAQNAAEMLVKSGVRGILNFAPVALMLPTMVYVQDVDMVIALEKVAYFARKNTSKDE
ncbi:MAG: redox-sensing transcriptional repressor Rex [Planctomycetota bacterium]